VRGHPEVEQYAVKALGIGETGRRKIGIVAQQRAELPTAFEVHQALARSGQRARVAVDAGDTHATLEQGGRMATTTQGAVEDGVGVGQQRFHFGQQDGDVVGPRAP